MEFVLLNLWPRKPRGASVTTLYRVQVGAFRNKSYAEAYKAKLKADGYDAFIVETKI